jgi:two-component system cell cycle sensor histidine kinase/response regulator CckA
VTGFVCTLSDITERRRIEQRLLESEKLETLGRIAGSLATDFDVQLEAIGGFAEKLRQGLSDPALRACADGIVSAGQTATELVRHLQAFAHKRPMRRERVDVHACLKTVAGVLHPTSDPRLVITLQLDAPHATVTGDPAQLENVFLNLGLNARDAMPGNGTLTFRTTTEQAEGAVPCLCIRVTDTGCGIAKEHLNHLFEPFFSTKGPHERLGLGLATVYGTIQQHGGAIAVESQPGAGTTFTIRLPLAAPPVQPI